ncbi:hypothetical protein PABG_05261 [Paracoccidioides brasiliensis Pb03]|nr:hypothetical protein PABG_05261 [Paracoccidioides brasiliensis Pb03]
MELWRERGFVPDSDEDEDFESQQSNKPSERNGGITEPVIREVEAHIPENSNTHEIQGDWKYDRPESQLASQDLVGLPAESRHSDKLNEGSGKVIESNDDEDIPDASNIHESLGDWKDDPPESQLDLHASADLYSGGRFSDNLSEEAGGATGEATHEGEYITRHVDSDEHRGDQDPAQDGPESQVVSLVLDNAPQEADDLEDDPLQFDDTLSTWILRAGRSSTTGNDTASSNAIRHPQSSSTGRSSSPDDLQFEQHFPSRTPIKSACQLNDEKGEQESGSEDSSLSPAQSNPPTPPSFRTSGPRRALRNRKFINLHPYLVDRAEYQRWCASNNIRPVRVPTTERYSIRQDESQEQEFVQENAPPSSSPAASIQFPSGSPAAGSKRKRLTHRARKFGGFPHTANTSNDFKPSSSVKLASQPTHYANASGKLRKISHAHGALGNELQEKRRNEVQIVIDNRLPQPPPGERNAIFDVPSSSPTPDPMSSNDIMQGLPEFRFPRGASSSPLGNTVLENDETSRNLEVISVDDSLDHDLSTSPKPAGYLHPQSPLQLATEGSTDEGEEIGRGEEMQDTEGSEEHEYMELKRLMRKIKGVLPASWPRLDLQRQQEMEKAVAEKSRLDYLRNRRQSGKGVAQRISRNRSNSYTRRPRPTPILIADESSSDSELTLSAQNSREPLPQLMDTDDLSEDADDIPEDNRIDYMLPPVPRRQKQRSLQLHRGLQSNQEKRPRSSFASRPKQRPKHQAKITDTLKRSRVISPPSKPRIPRLGILDSSDVRDQPVLKQPQFLRVAARQARLRRGFGRKSPTRTYLKLGTKLDTEDANKSLREWRAGSLHQGKITHNNSRKRRRQSYGNSAVGDTHDESNQSTVHQACMDARQSVLRIDVDARSAISDQTKAPSESRLSVQEGSVKSARPSNTSGRVGQRWAVRRQGFAISSLRRNAPRPAQLDLSGAGSRALNRASNFQRSLSALNSLYRTQASSLVRNTGLPMARFLAESPSGHDSHTSGSHEKTNSHGNLSLLPEQGQTRQPRQRRKRAPRQVNVQTVEHQQPPSVDMDIIETNSVKSAEATQLPSLIGLKPSEAVYTVNFDIIPLQIGTFFHSSTFIGSGDFSRSMRLSSRNMDHDNGNTVIQYANNTYQWSAWSESVSSELGTLLDTILDTVSTYESPSKGITRDPSTKMGHTVEVFRSIITYVNDKLFFMDPVDRLMFVDRCLVLLTKTFDTLQLLATDGPSSDSVISTTSIHFRMKLEVLNYVFTNQIRQIASHELVQSIKYSEIVGKMKAAQNRILQAVLSDRGLTDIRQFLEEVKWRQQRESGIKDEHPFLDAFVVVQKIFYTDPMLCGMNEDLLSQAILAPFTSHLPNDARELEKLWNGVFTTLPLYEFDEMGIFRPGKRFKENFDQWQTIRRLLSPVFDTYTLPSKMSSAPFNNYCRTLFHRCFYLIDGWGWRHSNVILDTLFDFFAKNMLHNLNQEQSFGSPGFLDELDRQPMLEMEPRDSCFHILLKTIGLGLRKMGDLYDKKKIRNFAWRLLPNHGRDYPKDQPLRVEDLDALRNHHDLLCTLYWATPDTCRPRVEIIRNLVHPARSHKEVCSINIHSWLRLVRFKLSTNDNSAGLIPFAEWHTSFVLDMLQQHSHARTDIEAQAASNSLFSRQTIEKAVIDYQKPIESLLSVALVNLKIAIDSAKAPVEAKVLVDRFPLARLLELLNTKIPRLQPLICNTLDIVLAYTNSNTKSRAPTGLVDTGDDSQEFEGWAVFAELCEQEEGRPKANPPVEHLDDTIRPALARYLSSCFGEDQAPDDVVLLKVVNSWASVAYTLVSYGLREWGSYLGQYGEDSWASLRATDQTRKFLPYFLSCLIEKDKIFYTECKRQVLHHWIECIVARGSSLKYQHVLTNAIMNVDGSNAMLRNLPFSRNPISQRYEITLQEFSQRRLSLISCILSNMREHLSDAEDLGAHIVQNTRSQYRELVEALMGAMKSNYSELGKINDSVQSSYVGFVHRIVGFLQQHSQKICPIDPFFTNPSTFPLPADDPNYIVGKLKGYAVRLTSSKVANELFTFLHHVSERAAVDGQQMYLVDQLYAAMAESAEPGENHQTTILIFFLRCILPAYIEVCLVAPGAWILVRPLLQSLTRILMGSILFINACDGNCVSVLVGALTCYFEAVDSAVRLLVDHPGLLDEPHILLTVTSLLETITTSLPAIDYLDRSCSQAATLVAYVDIFKQFALFAASTLLNPENALAPQTLDMALTHISQENNYHPPSQFFADARGFAARGLQSRFRDGWSFRNGKYFVRPEHSQQVKEIVNDPACTSAAFAKEAFIKTVEIFFGTMDGLQTFSSSSF